MGTLGPAGSPAQYPALAGGQAFSSFLTGEGRSSAEEGGATAGFAGEGSHVGGKKLIRDDNLERREKVVLNDASCKQSCRPQEPSRVGTCVGGRRALPAR